VSSYSESCSKREWVESHEVLLLRPAQASRRRDDRSVSHDRSRCSDFHAISPARCCIGVHVKGLFFFLLLLCDHVLYFIQYVGPTFAPTFWRPSGWPESVRFSISCDFCKPLSSLLLVNLADVFVANSIPQSAPVMHLKVRISVVLSVGDDCFRSCFNGIDLIRGPPTQVSSLSCCLMYLVYLFLQIISPSKSWLP